MIKIGILHQGSSLNWGYNFGYWFFPMYFKNELNTKGYKIRFFKKFTKEFFNSDFIIINSRIYTDAKINFIKKKFNLHSNHNFIDPLKKIIKKNPNIIWLDLSDSAGNTQFEVLPYVKKYVKKQFYKDKSLYKINYFRNRFYSDYYQKRFNLENNSVQKFTILNDKYSNKLVQGWNIGVGNYFDSLKYNKFIKFKSIFLANSFSNYKELFKYTLDYYNENFKKNDIFFKFNLRNSENKISIHYQRQRVNEILTNYYGYKNFNRLSHRDFLISLKNSKISVGAFGWGEVCYREFEAIKMGAAIIFPNMDNIETWPNIYQDRITYLSYNYDLKNLLAKVEELLNDQELRTNLIKNSQEICKSVYDVKGLNFLINFFKKITE